MKNKGLIITLIVLLCIIAVALIWILCLGIQGKNFNFGIVSENVADSIIYDKSFDAELMNNIEILSSAGNVKIEESSEPNIRAVVYGKNDNGLKVNNSSNKLEIDYTEHNTGKFFFGQYLSEIILYVPSNYSKEIDIDVDYGDIEVCDLESGSLKIKASCGNVEIGKIKNVEINSDLGDVDIESILNKLDIETDCGSIKIKNIDLKENSTIKCDLGDVKIGSTNNVFFDTSVDLGDSKINKNDRHSEVTLKIEVDCGDIKVEN